LAAALLAASSPAAAQTISPGMTSAQVRSVGDWSYLYYLNGCAVRCGSDDVVFIQNDRVVAAVFRTGSRRFAGPVAGVALDGTAGDRSVSSRGDHDSGMVRLDETPERPTQMRVRNGAREEPGRTIIGRPGAARVGGVRLEAGDGSGGTTIIRRDETDPRDDARRGGPPARAGSLDARGRVNDTRPDDRNRLTGTGVDGPEDDVAAGDSARAPATAVDDARRAREGRVEANTVRRGNTSATADSTLNRARRERERNVTPRTVTRP
jgi:hypothetical protein